MSPDPFGLTGKVGGIVVDDVDSRMFFEKNAAELPGASSDVTVLATASAALGDLAAVGRSQSLACLQTMLAEIASAEAGSTVDVKVVFEPLPRYGTGNGGVGLRFALSGHSLKSTLYEDEDLYLQGRAEVSLTFANLGAPFPPSWAQAITAKVMGRARLLAG